MTHETHEMLNRLTELGIETNDAYALRRIAMTLDRWHEMESGTGNGQMIRTIEREGENGDGAPYIRTQFPTAGGYVDRRYRIADRETGAKKRLAAIMARYPSLIAYIQTDPRGASLYILRLGDVPDGADVDAYYSRGIAVYK